MEGSGVEALEVIDGLDGRFETAQAFLAEAAQATCDYDRKLFERVAARYWKAAIGMEDIGGRGDVDRPALPVVPAKDASDPQFW